MLAQIILSLANFDDLAFEQWAAAHSKVYASAGERAHRFGIWQRNAGLVAAHPRSASYTVGLNKFSDRTPAEYKVQDGMTSCVFPASEAAVLSPVGRASSTPAQSHTLTCSLVSLLRLSDRYLSCRTLHQQS